MKNYVIITLLIGCGFGLHGQTMKWVPLPKGTSSGTCVCAAPSKSTLQCYALEYTPNVSGVLTSYTTAFLVSCTSHGSAIAKNEACYMSNKTNVMNGCNEVGKVMMISAGNSGSANNSKIEAGKPVFLHQVCFTIPEGESITIEKEASIQLTTSVDLAIGKAVTEFPEYIRQTVTHPKYDAVRPSDWLDIQIVSAGERTAQIDWSVASDKEISHFVIEHATDGIHFSPVGEVKAEWVPGDVHAYQFLDPKASEGVNYYRIQLVQTQTGNEFSPVRTLSFGAKPFTVFISPNPAAEYIQVDVTGQKQDYEIRLFDAFGKLIMERKPDRKTIQSKLKVDALSTGLYTVQVICGEDTYSENIAVQTR